MLVADYGSTLVGGNCSVLTAGDGSTLMGGVRCHLVAGNDSVLVGGEGCTLQAGDDSTLMGDRLCSLTWKVWQGDRYRIYTRYTGEDGIEVNRPYRGSFRDGVFVIERVSFPVPV